MTLPGETVTTGAPKPEGEELQVLYSPAGFYLGYLENGMPYSRETGYYDTAEEAESILEAYTEALASGHEGRIQVLEMNYFRL